MKRFPVGLTIAALIVFAVLIGLGEWQLRRLDETNLKRARLAALVHASPRPLEEVLAQARRGEDVDHTRVSARCAPVAPTSPIIYRYSVLDGEVGWRLLAMCPLAASGFDGIVIDRGRVAALDGAVDPRPIAFSAPGGVTGVLRSLGGGALLGDDMPSQAPVRLVRVVDPRAIGGIARVTGVSRPAPYYLVVETEDHPPSGVTPAPVAEDVPRDNFQYAMTWFGLAAALAWVYAAMVWRRLKGR